MSKPRFYRVVALIIVSVWISFAAIGTSYFEKLSDLSSTDLATFVPQNADSSQVSKQVKRFTERGGTPLVTVFEKNNNNLSNSDLQSIDKVASSLTNIPDVLAIGGPAIISEDNKAAFSVIYLSSGSNFQSVFNEIEKQFEDAQLPVNYTFTGAASFSKDLQGAFSKIDTTLLLVAVSCVFIILLFIYRSPFLPIIVILSAVIALSVSVVVAYLLVDAGTVQLNGQVQGILFILVIGAAADYSLLYISRYREQLLASKSAASAALTALRSSLPSIVAAGATVSAGLLCLLASDLGSNKALGPIGTVGILFSVLSAITLLPALLVLFGRSAFWPKIPHYSNPKALETFRLRHRFWTGVAKFVSKFPRLTWIVCVSLLFAGSLNIINLKADGIPQGDILIGESEARNGQAIIDRHFPAGSGSPAVIITPSSSVEQAVIILDANRDISSVSLAASVPQGSIPTGKAEKKLRDKIRSQVQEKRQMQLDAVRNDINSQLKGFPMSVVDLEMARATNSIPSVDSLAEQSYPFTSASVKEVNGNVLLYATLNSPADSIAARQTIESIRSQFMSMKIPAKIGGVSATQLDTSLASQHDIRVIIPLILIAITIILMFLLRAVVAPLILLASTILSFTATMGIAALVFNNVWNFAGADPTVIIIAFVFLVALGIDYNIFLMTRVREETLAHGVKQGTLKGLIVTGGVITGAGVVLATTFAALNIIPVVYLVEIASIVSFGVLLDTIIVRSLLVPAVTLEIGQKMWWPSKISKRKHGRNTRHIKR